jgi:hypothetical protein
VGEGTAASFATTNSDFFDAIAFLLNLHVADLIFPLVAFACPHNSMRSRGVLLLKSIIIYVLLLATWIWLVDVLCRR